MLFGTYSNEGERRVKSSWSISLLLRDSTEKGCGWSDGYLNDICYIVRSKV